MTILHGVGAELLRNKQFELDKGLSFNQFSNWLEWATIWVSSGKPIEELSEELKMGSNLNWLQFKQSIFPSTLQLKEIGAKFNEMSIETQPMEPLSNGIQMGSGYARNQDL